MDELLIRALLGGMIIALVAGPLGAFIVWRRMAYFGDTLAHSGLLGVSIGLLIGVHPTIGVFGVCLGLAVLLVLFERQRRLATDTLLGILSHTALALGLVALAFLETVRVDLVNYLFGDILAVTWQDIITIGAIGGLVLSLLIYLWHPLLSMTVHEELAQVESVPVFWMRLILMLLIAIVIAVAMKIIGILLITSLLIIPAAAARRWVNTPEQMACLASLLGCVAVSLGLWLSFVWDTPTGPSMVVMAALLFVVGLIPDFIRTR